MVEPRLWASALDGNRDALLRCLELDPEGSTARAQRVATALALVAEKVSGETLREGADAGNSGDLYREFPAFKAWKSRLRQVVAHSLMLEDGLERTGRILKSAGIRWAPLKGLDLGARVYPRSEERPTSDIDLLIHSADLDKAQGSLLEAGWRSLNEGRRVERYLRAEGYAWQARAPSGVLVEVHHRLWGSVMGSAGDAMLEAATADSSLPGGFRLRLAHAYIVAAHHLWLDPAPRRLGTVRDLVMISRAASAAGPASNIAANTKDTQSFVDEVISAAREWDLQLSVALGARWSAELWDEPGCVAIAQQLQSCLASAERLWWRRQGDPASASFATMTLARHLSRRRTRHGLGRLALRRLWAHPGIVEAAYGAADGRSFWRRRLAYQLRAWGWP